MMAMAAICPRNLLPDRIPPLCYTTYNLNVTGGGGHILQADNKPTNEACWYMNRMNDEQCNVTTIDEPA